MQTGEKKKVSFTKTLAFLIGRCLNEGRKADDVMNANNKILTRRGRRFEMTILGDTVEWEQAVRVPRLTFAASLEDAKANAAKKFHEGTWNPRSPPTYAGLLLLQAVRRALRLPLSFQIELVTALGTSLDYDWGVDCLIILAGTEIMVTVDLTTNPKKTRSGNMRADLFFTPVDLASSEALNTFARKAANLLRKRYKAFQHLRKPTVYPNRLV